MDIQIISRVASRTAKEFSSPGEMRRYLKDHPKADRSKHHVTKHETQAPKEEPEKAEKEPEKAEAPKGFLNKLKALGGKAAEMVSKAPKAAQKFLADPQVRKEALGKAQEHLKAAPEKLVKGFLKTAKHEIHEFKTAGEGVAAVMKGGKMSKDQKAAFKTASFHLGLTIAAAALSAATPLAGAVGVSKALARHVAMKSVNHALGHLHILDELGHVGHGVAHILTKLGADEKGKVDPEQAFVKFMMANVAKELESLNSEESISEALSNADSQEG